MTKGSPSLQAVSHLARYKSDALENLKDLARKDAPPLDRLPDALNLGEITRAPEVFQMRLGVRVDDGSGTDPDYVEELRERLGKLGDDGLDPLLVMRVGDQWMLVDGHHRFEAYLASGDWEGRPVPVEVFEGSIEEALAQATRENRKLKRPLRAAEGAEGAWRHLCITAEWDAEKDKLRASPVNAKEIAGQFGVSESLYSKMRSRMNEVVRSTGGSKEPAWFGRFCWADVRNKGFLEGSLEGPGAFDRNKAVDHMVRMLRKLFKQRPDKVDAGVLLEALDAYHKPLVLKLAEQMVVDRVIDVAFVEEHLADLD